VSGEVGRGTFVQRRTIGVQEGAIDEGDDPALIDLSKGRLVRDRRDPTPARTLQALSQTKRPRPAIGFLSPCGRHGARHPGGRSRMASSRGSGCRT